MNAPPSETRNDIAPIPADKQQIDYGAAFLEEEKKSLFDFPTARQKLEALIKEWAPEIEETESRRAIRNIDVDVDELRENEDIGADETFLTMRVIDTTIKREQPPYINFIRNSRRIASFTDMMDSDNAKTEDLEIQFTRGMTYTGWERPIYKAVDGSQTHGWASAEVVFDRSKPLNTGIEYIPHEKLFFPKDCINIQHAEMIMRVYDLTKTQLKRFVVKFGFNGNEVSTLITQRTDPLKVEKNFKVYKLFFKWDTVVYVAWFSVDASVADWLKAPVKHYVGIRNQVTSTVNVSVQTGVDVNGMPMMEDVPQQQTDWQDSILEQYPIFLLPYGETECETIFDYKGRVFLDGPSQEAQTSIATAFVNGLTRSSMFYASYDSPDDASSGAPKQIEMAIEPGKIVTKPLKFFNIPYPDPLMLKSLQVFDTIHSQEANQVSFAVNNRQDSRKTATEIDSANKQQGLLTGVNLTLFSTFIREVYSFAWLIVQSQALQDKVVLLPVQNPEYGTNPEQAAPYVNDYQTISGTYDVRAAGDVDVILREQKLQSMMQDWPLVASIPALAKPFLQDMLRAKYPEDGEKYAKFLDVGDVTPVVIQKLLDLVMQNVHPATPQDMQAMNQLIQEAQMILKSTQQPQAQASGQQAGNQQPQQPQNTQAA
jgi:hypothetical protein